MKMSGCNRRGFAQIMAGAILSQAIDMRFGWNAWAAAKRTRFAYIGAEDGIHVYSIAEGGHFMQRQTIASANPVAMAISGWNLYVANGLSEFGGLPRGTVEAYGIDSSTGRLKFRNRVPLSLSGVLPRSLAVAPDGKKVVVAVHGGGLYNVLPVCKDGLLGRVSGILKETGSGPHSKQASAHPSAVIFDSGGQVLSADEGSDRLNVFTLYDDEINVAYRQPVAASSGPASIVLHPNGKQLYVAHGLNPSVSIFQYDMNSGRVLTHKNTISTSGINGATTLAMHPSGETMYSSHGHSIQLWKIAGAETIHCLQRIENVQCTALHVTENGESLFALTDDGLLRIKIDAAGGMLPAPTQVASQRKPTSIAFV
jgi:6-phosphogluconolactonase